MPPFGVRFHNPMISKTAIIAVLLLGTVFTQIVPQYPAIIIGAGIAGLGASAELTNKSIPHLLIEVRDRIGGRFAPLTFGGLKMDAGASFVHYPYDDGNMLHKYVKNFKMPTLDANFSKEANFYAQNKSVYSAADMAAAEVIYQNLTDYIWNQGWYLSKDAAVTVLINQFWNTTLGKSVPTNVKDWVNHNMLEEAVDNGADLSTMSAWEWDGEHDGSDAWDYLPTDTMYQLANKIFNNNCTKAVLHLSEKVLKIDYSGSNIVVTTDKGSYSSNTVFSSFPIGVLKELTGVFVPPLPTKTATAISNIGSGVFEKLVVKFSTKFWPDKKSIISFVGRGVNSNLAEAFVVPGSDTILMFFIGGNKVANFYAKTRDQLITFVQDELKKYTTASVVVEDIYLTRWGQDPYTKCGYSYAKIGTKSRDFTNIKAPIVSGNNKLYMIGEHTHINLYSYAHGAYHSGRDAVLSAF